MGSAVSLVPTTYPSGLITPYGASELLAATVPMCAYRSYDGYSAWHLMGGHAPVIGVQDGVNVVEIKGLLPTWKVLDQQGANQDGTTFSDALYDPIELDMKCVVSGRSPQGRRDMVRRWIGAWDVHQPGEFSWTTLTNGKWMGAARWHRSPVDPLANGRMSDQRFIWSARIDSGFYSSYDSVSKFQPGDSGGTGFIQLANRGDQPGWPRYTVYGPGTFNIANGPGSTQMIKFGPILAGQIVLLTTQPRLRSVVDLSPVSITTTPQELTQFQELIEALVNLASLGNTPPLLELFESVFGILPPQGILYKLLEGRFTKSIAPKPEGVPPITSKIACSITGGNASSKINAAVTPKRRYPE